MYRGVLCTCLEGFILIALIFDAAYDHKMRNFQSWPYDHYFFHQTSSCGSLIHSLMSLKCSWSWCWSYPCSKVYARRFFLFARVFPCAGMMLMNLLVFQFFNLFRCWWYLAFGSLRVLIFYTRLRGTYSSKRTFDHKHYYARTRWFCNRCQNWVSQWADYSPTSHSNSNN